jgi:hypothetical protein
VQVHYDDEGIASQIGSEPCAGRCEEIGELSRDRKLIPGADAVRNMPKGASAGSRSSLVVQFGFGDVAASP